ncbi:MAG: transketolase-like TK C-terminal-containing protein, partial [Blastopirellula sp. JB062]
FDGMKKMYVDGETAIYYITVGNENYAMPAMPEGAQEGIVRGIYKLNSRDASKGKNRVQLFGSGPILRCVLDAQQILADKYQVSSDVWSVTSYTELRRDAHACQRWNMLHPLETPRKSYLEEVMEGVQGPFIASSDNVRALPEQIRDYLPGALLALGTDGMGRSETREALRRHFEIDSASVVIAALYQLFREGKVEAKKVAKAIKDLDYDPEKVDPYFA